MKTVLSPVGENQALFFLHIPKTAGSAVVNAVKKKIGADCVAEFIEEDILRYAQGKEFTEHRADFASAHTNMNALGKSGIIGNYKIFTVLRDGFDRLVSHINWMDRFNHGIDPEKYERLRPAMKRLVQQLARTDETSESDLRRLFVADEADKLRHFYNGQLNKLIVPKYVDMFSYLKLDKIDRAGVESLYSVFHRIGDIDIIARLLLDAYGVGRSELLERTVNVAKSQRFTTSNEALRHISTRWWRYDQFLVDTVAELNAESGLGG